MSNRIESPEFLSLAVDVKRNAGAQKYIGGIADDLKARLLAVPEPGRVTDRSGEQPKLYEVRHRVVHDGQVRSLDSEGLRRAKPGLWQRAHTPRQASKKYSMYFSRDRLWQQEQAVGAQRARELWQRKTSDVVWSNPTAISGVLLELRKDLRARKVADNAMRVRMSRLLEDKGYDAGLLYVGDGAIDARNYFPGYDRDWAVLDASPEADQFIKYVPRAGYSTVVFVPVPPDDDPEAMAAFDPTVF